MTAQNEKKECKKLIREQKRELELTKNVDRIFPEVITPRKIPFPLSKEKLAFLLHIAGYTEKNIAQVLSRSVGTIRRYLKGLGNKWEQNGRRWKQ